MIPGGGLAWKAGEGFIHMPGNEHCLPRGHHSSPPLAGEGPRAELHQGKAGADRPLAVKALELTQCLGCINHSKQVGRPTQLSRGREIKRQFWMGRAQWMCDHFQSTTCPHPLLCQSDMGSGRWSQVSPVKGVSGQMPNAMSILEEPLYTLAC